MEKGTILEQILYKCPYIDAKRYPLLPEEELTALEIEASRDNSVVYCFPFCRENEGDAYIDIYLFDAALPEGCKRFVMAEGYSLEAEEEAEFLNYMSMELAINGKVLDRLIRQVNERIPQIHLQYYLERTHILLHLYYTLHRSGAYELLYKANLDYVAERLHEVEDYNMIGGSPQEIMNVQLGMLYAMNSPEGMQELLTLKGRETARKMYARFHNLLHNTEINTYQWKYLCELLESGEPPNSRMFEMLGNMWNDKQYHSYLRYREYRENIGDYYALLPEFPEVEELREKETAGNIIRGYIEYEDFYDEMLETRARQYQERYYFEGDGYVIYVPSSLDEILRESAKQRNCLFWYVDDMAADDTIILFMREKANPQKSLVTINVDNGCIIEARQAFNKGLNREQIKVIAKYMKAKNLTIMDAGGEYEEVLTEVFGEE